MHLVVSKECTVFSGPHLIDVIILTMQGKQNTNMEIIYDGNSTLKLHYLSGCNILGAVGDENSSKGKSLPFENERMNGKYIILSQVVVIIIRIYHHD